VSANFIAYRDRLAPASETEFLNRQYLAFRRLQPLWIGRHRDAGIARLNGETRLLGEGSVWGAVARTTYPVAGWVPDIAVLAALRPRLVHAQFLRGGILAMSLATRLRLPLVVTLHGGDVTKRHSVMTELARAGARRRAALDEQAARFICVSEFIRDRALALGFSREKLIVHYIGTEIAAAAPPAQRADAPYLFVGRLIEKKGVRILLDAFRLLRRSGIERPLHIVGDGALRADMEASARDLSGIVFAGWLDPASVRARMASSYAVLVPSVTAPNGDAEGLPSVVLEAMAAGTAVIASRHAGIPEAVTDHETGLLAREGDAADWAAQIALLDRSPELRRTLAVAARRRVEERFAAAAQSAALETILEDVIARGAGAVA
jgi:glycosyltransferase involved in cell wall biosynthesis